MFNIDPLDLAIRVPVVLLALTLHEFAHAYSAYRLGDPTAYRLGRVSLNPLVHLDLLGTLCLLFAPIGWAKPVPVIPINFRNPGRDDIVVAAAGPISNLIQAFLFALLFRVVLDKMMPITDAIGPNAYRVLYHFLIAGVAINAALAVFNLIPLYPLDGFHVVGNLTHGELQQRFLALAPHGPYFILGLVLLSQTRFDPLGRIIAPVVSFFLHRIGGLPALPFAS